jgi:hypothetical protein
VMGAAQIMGGEIAKQMAKTTSDCTLAVGYELLYLTLACITILLGIGMVFGTRLVSWISDYLTLRYWTVRLLIDFDPEIFSMLVEKYGERYTDLRPILRVSEIPIFGSPRTHTHGKAASERTATNAEMARTIRRTGRRPYHVSMSRADQARGDSGKRIFYWDKDMKTKYRNDLVEDDHVLVFTDVEFHVPMDKYLAYGLPILAYTVVPEAAAKRSVDSCYHFEGNEVVYEIAGGGRYKHMLWDYDRDTVRAELEYGPHAGDTVIFDIEQKVVSESGTSHRVIGLFPSFRIPAALAKTMPECKPLTRRKYLQNGIISVYEPISGLLSLAIDGRRESVELPARLFQALLARIKAKTTAFTVGDIEVYIQDAFPKSAKIEAALLYEILTVSGANLEYRPNVIKTNALITSYRPLASLPLGDDKDTGRSVSTPLVAEPAMFARRCLDTDEVAVKGRVTDVMNKTVPPPVYEQYKNEFTDLIVTPEIRGTGTPLNIEDVESRQHRQTQKSRTQQALHLLGLGGKNKIQTFIKAEPYGNVSDPRIISTCLVALTIGLSRFTYAFKEAVLKRMPWYGPGQEPLSIAQRLAKLCRKAVVETDYSRFDGTISEWLQDVAKGIYAAWFTMSEIPVLLQHYQEVFKNTATTQNGMRYKAGNGTRSGSPITTDANTMINAFVNYCAYRKAGLTPRRAWMMLGIYAGDDGVSQVVPGFVETLAQVVRDLGLTVKSQVNPRNTRTTFLSRVFPSPETCQSSYQCVKRTLPKLHLTASSGISAMQAAYNRAIGYLTTDSRTPLIREWCLKMVALAAENGITTLKGVSNNETHRQSMAWPQNEEDAEIIKQGVANDLGMTTAELDERSQAITDAKTTDEIPVVWNNKREVKITAMVGDTVVHPINPIVKDKVNETSQPQTKWHTSSNTLKVSLQATQQRKKQIPNSSAKLQKQSPTKTPSSAKSSKKSLISTSTKHSLRSETTPAATKAIPTTLTGITGKSMLNSHEKKDTTPSSKCAGKVVKEHASTSQASTPKKTAISG